MAADEAEPLHASKTDRAAPEYPIIFIPGTGGSFLKMPIGLSAKRAPDQREDGTFEDHWWDWTPWVDVTIAARGFVMQQWLKYLKLEADGTDREGLGIYPAGIFEYVPSFYGALMRRLELAGYSRREDWLRPFPYDFRIDPKLNADRLGKLVRDTLERTGREKVVLISHSQGGLVARGYIAGANAENAHEVRASITLGTPWLGVVWCMKALGPFGWNFGQGIVDPLVIRQLAQNWPAVYTMLPAEDWPYDEPFFRYVDEEDASVDEKPVEFVERTHNSALYQAQRKWRRDILDRDDHGVENVVVVGEVPDLTPIQ